MSKVFQEFEAKYSLKNQTTRWKLPLNWVKHRGETRNVNNRLKQLKEDWKGLHLRFLEACWPKSFSKFIFVVYNVWYNALEAYLFDTTLWSSHSHLISGAQISQGHPTTVFCKKSVRRSKNCLEFSIAWGRLKISRWLFHSCTIFEA